MKTANKIVLSALFVAASMGLFSFSGGNDELKYVGTLNNNPVFELTVNIPDEDGFTITVADEYNNVLYKQQVKGSVYSKKFLLNADEIGDDALHFIITGKKTNVSRVYKISNDTRLVQQPVISKIQ